MLQLADLEQPSPAELVALARLAQDPTLIPPPHLRADLEIKGWLKTSHAGFPLLTGRGRELVERA
jgi:hypothetical protein